VRRPQSPRSVRLSQTYSGGKIAKLYQVSPEDSEDEPGRNDVKYPVARSISDGGNVQRQSSSHHGEGLHHMSATLLWGMEGSLTLSLTRILSLDAVLQYDKA
jgi:hypothetical protein